MAPKGSSSDDGLHNTGRRSSVEQSFARALDCHQRGLLDEASGLYQGILDVAPDHVDTLHLLGVVNYQRGRYAEAERLIASALVGEPHSAEALVRSNYGLALKALNRNEEALASYDRALALKPDFVEAYYNRGNTLMDLKRLEEALASYDKALAIKPDYAEAHTNRGNALIGLNRPDEALASYDNALAIKPNYVEAHYNRGKALRNLKRPEEALASYDNALAIMPNYAEAHYNRGNTLMDLKRLEEALASYDKALAIKPNYAEAHYNAGLAVSQQNKFAEAAMHFGRAIEINPKFLAAHVNLALRLSDMGDAVQAVEAARRALRLDETAETRATFARCAANLQRIPDPGADFCGLLTRALTGPWHRPMALAGVCVGCLEADPTIRKCMEQVTKAWPERLSRGMLFGSSRLDTVSRNSLLQAVLETTPVCGRQFELLLTSIRFALLQTAASEAQVKGLALHLYSALAQQCFINGYIYACTDEERDQALALREKLVAALRSGTRISSLWPIAVAAYFPLHTVDDVDALLARTWPDGVDAVLRQQVREPRQEFELRKEIPRITVIANDVSMQVREFYEENSYPRWVKAVVTSRADYPQDLEREPLSILVAGCGTGQHSIETAQAYPRADILAIDLSLTSLGYALRKSREAGLDRIRYAQADILELAALDQKFDLIEAGGVLHHLSNPLQGWRVLLSLLRRPGGRMRIALYSQLARRVVTAAQTFFAERGYSQSTDDIRRGRHELWLASDRDPSLRAIGTMTDFYDLGSCRDLLFHIQEHRFTLPAIKAFLDETDLAFEGFDLPVPVITKYRSQFPEDQTATNLNSWYEFETKYPDTFIGMYQFRVQSRFA